MGIGGSAARERRDQDGVLMRATVRFGGGVQVGRPARIRRPPSPSEGSAGAMSAFRPALAPPARRLAGGNEGGQGGAGSAPRRLDALPGAALGRAPGAPGERAPATACALGPSLRSGDSGFVRAAVEAGDERRSRRALELARAAAPPRLSVARSPAPLRPATRAAPAGRADPRRRSRDPRACSGSRGPRGDQGSWTGAARRKTTRKRLPPPGRSTTSA